MKIAILQEHFHTISTMGGEVIKKEDAMLSSRRWWKHSKNPSDHDFSIYPGQPLAI